MLAKDIMDASAALLNDRALTIFTYVAQLPYLNIALTELREIMAQNNVPVTNAVQSSTIVTAGLTGIGGPSSNPALPARLIEPQTLYERLSGTSDEYIEMKKRNFLPRITTLTTSLIYWAWQDQMIKFLGATTDRQILIEYIADAVAKVQDENDIIRIIGCQTFLEFRNAGLCAQHIGENEARATVLNGNAQTAMDRFLSIATKGRQATPVRRRPFNASYKTYGRG